MRLRMGVFVLGWVLGTCALRAEDGAASSPPAQEIPAEVRRFNEIVEKAMKGEKVSREDADWARAAAAAALKELETPNAVQEMRLRLAQAVDLGIREGKIKPQDRDKTFRTLMEQALQMRWTMIQSLKEVLVKLDQAR